MKNAERSKLLEMIEENGWEILNDSTEGDEEGELTFIGGKGNSVIDYVIIYPLVKEEIKCFKGRDRNGVGSFTTNGRNIWGKLEADSLRKENERMRNIWIEEGVNQYKEGKDRQGGILSEEQGVQKAVRNKKRKETGKRGGRV